LESKHSTPSVLSMNGFIIDTGIGGKLLSATDDASRTINKSF